jgi:hypothetical protein
MNVNEDLLFTVPLAVAHSVQAAQGVLFYMTNGGHATRIPTTNLRFKKVCVIFY